MPCCRKLAVPYNLEAVPRVNFPDALALEMMSLPLSWRRALAQNLTKPVRLISTRSWVRPKNVPVFCMGCFLSVENGEPIKVHTWLTVHCPFGGLEVCDRSIVKVE